MTESQRKKVNEYMYEIYLLNKHKIKKLSSLKFYTQQNELKSTNVGELPIIEYYIYTSFCNAKTKEKKWYKENKLIASIHNIICT